MTRAWMERKASHTRTDGMRTDNWMQFNLSHIVCLLRTHRWRENRQMIKRHNNAWENNRGGRAVATLDRMHILPYGRVVPVHVHCAVAAATAAYRQLATLFEWRQTPNEKYITHFSTSYTFIRNAIGNESEPKTTGTTGLEWNRTNSSQFFVCVWTENQPRDDEERARESEQMCSSSRWGVMWVCACYVPQRLK